MDPGPIIQVSAVDSAVGDLIDCKGRARLLPTSEVDSFVREVLLSPERTLPVVAVTFHFGTGQYLIDPDELAAALVDRAVVVAIATKEATFELSGILPSGLNVFGGAARIWWPELTSDSDPHDHPLILMRPPRNPQVVARIVDAIHKSETGGGRARYSTLAGVGSARRIQDAVISRVEGGAIYVHVEGSEGQLIEADVPLARVAADARVGESLRVRRKTESGLWSFTTKGLTPDPWRRVGERYSKEDIVHARVARVDGGGVLVELLPGAYVRVPKSELDWEVVRNPGELFEVGEHVVVRLLSLDVEAQQGIASIKQGYLGAPLPLLAPSPGERAFLAGKATAAEKVGAPKDVEVGGIVSLEQEVESLSLDRDALAQRLRAATDQNADLRKQVRSFEDRLRAVDAADDPLASGAVFLRSTRIEYARQCDEGTRFEKPLLAMRVGPGFLKSVRHLEGITIEKVVEVCAQVASDRAHLIAAREVHRLRNGAAGTVRSRTRDGAVAWRCALQIGTASARRLHWWDVTLGGKRTIEFATVALHDDMSIPD